MIRQTFLLSLLMVIVFLYFESPTLMELSASEKARTMVCDAGVIYASDEINEVRMSDPSFELIKVPGESLTKFTNQLLKMTDGEEVYFGMKKYTKKSKNLGRMVIVLVPRDSMTGTSLGFIVASISPTSLIMTKVCDLDTRPSLY